VAPPSPALGVLPIVKAGPAEATPATEIKIVNKSIRRIERALQPVVRIDTFMVFSPRSWLRQLIVLKVRAET
jgi:hypothetical protein